MKAFVILLALAASALAQGAPGSDGWHGSVVDASGAVIANAHVYIRSMRSNDADTPVVHVADSDASGQFVLKLADEPRYVLVFAAGFRPWTGLITDDPVGSHSLKVKMQAVPCDYPGVNCDTVDTKPFHKKK